METSKLATPKRITFKQTEALAAEKGATLTRECETETNWRRHGRGSITITKEHWYQLSTLPDKKFSQLTDVRDFLLQGVQYLDTPRCVTVL
jgi:hypothetical protein